MISSDVQKPEDTPNPTLTPKLALVHVSAAKLQKPKWEKILPKAYTIASAEGNPKSLKLKVEIETTDTAQKKSVMALLNSGATGEFIDWDYAKSCRFNLTKLTEPILVHNADGTLNESSSIMEVVSLILHYNNHSERTTFVVTCFGKQKVLLGHSWLQNIIWRSIGPEARLKCPDALHVVALVVEMSFDKKGSSGKLKPEGWMPAP